MKEELSKNVKILKEICEEEKLNVLDADVLDFAVRMTNSEKIESGKNKRTEKMNKEDPATDKQIKALKKLGKYKEGITKKEAWNIISKSK